MTANDLAAAFATLPTAWRRVLPGWTEDAQQALIDAIRSASGERAIAPADPFRALRLVAPDAARVVRTAAVANPDGQAANGLAALHRHRKADAAEQRGDGLSGVFPGRGFTANYLGSSSILSKKEIKGSSYGLFD